MNSDFSKAFLTATSLLPDRLWRAAFSLDQTQRENCEEIRIRVGRRPTARVCGKYIYITDNGVSPLVTKEDIEAIIRKATNSSMHSYAQQIKRGFITTREGHRIGLTGQIVTENGEVSNLRDVSSVNIRIAKPVYGVAGKVLKALEHTDLKSILVVSAPGAGKTTLLRDMARLMSKSCCVAIADERYEIAGEIDGKASFDIGECDIMSGGNKAESIEMLIRAMSPSVIVLDEITSENDVNVLCRSSYCGCNFIASAHCSSVKELEKRKVYGKLIETDLFNAFVFINDNSGTREYTVYTAEDLTDAENTRTNNDNRIMLGNRFFREQKLYTQDKLNKVLYFRA